MEMDLEMDENWPFFFSSSFIYLFIYLNIYTGASSSETMTRKTLSKFVVVCSPCLNPVNIW